MANTERIGVVRHIPLDGLDELIDSIGLQDDLIPAEKKRMVQRLSFIRLRYKGYSVAESADILKINRQSGYNWQSAWNSGGPDALKPGFGGGAPSRLTSEQRGELATYVGGGACPRNLSSTMLRRHTASSIRGCRSPASSIRRGLCVAGTLLRTVPNRLVSKR